MKDDCVLLLEDGHIFLGRGFGFSNRVCIVDQQLKAETPLTGELCFNTGMSGYQEVLSDPSYAGQIICFSFPHIGNVGTNWEDDESAVPYVRAMVTREYPTQPSNWRNQKDLNSWLIQHKISGIAGVDTRALIHHLRENGSMRALVCRVDPELEGVSELLRQHLLDSPKMVGQSLSETTSRTKTESYRTELRCRWLPSESAKRDQHIAVLDFGVKENILQLLQNCAAKLTIFPLKSSWQGIAACRPDGLFLSNGPGDPEPVYEQIKEILEQAFRVRLPIFGICLGHQLLALHLGGGTQHMHHGHRGINHPVWNLERGIVEVTSQNHGFCVSELPESVKITHRSLFDSSIEGMRCLEYPMFSVQYHPEASPGPHDSMYLFEDFADLMEKHSNVF